MQLVETRKTTTAETDVPDDVLIGILKAEAAKRVADPPFQAGDVVTLAEGGVAERFQLLKPFGVVMTSDPLRRSTVVLCLDVHGNGVPIYLEPGMAVRPYAAGAGA